LLAFEKSYSLRIKLGLLTCGRTSRYEANAILAAHCINQREEASLRAHADKDPALLGRSAVIGLSQAIRVKQGRRRLFECDTMLLEVRSGLRRVPLDFHMHMICISEGFRNRSRRWQGVSRAPNYPAQRRRAGPEARGRASARVRLALGRPRPSTLCQSPIPAAQS